jgi:hypothetical protein
VGAVNKLSLISDSVTEIRINNQPYRGIQLTNMTWVHLRIGYVCQPFTMIPYGGSGSHLSRVHFFHVIPHSGLSVGGPYTIRMLISTGMVGYHPTTTITKLCWFTGLHKSDMRSVHNQILIQGSTTNGPQSAQARAITLEPRISTSLSPTIPTDDTSLSPSCPARSQI